MGWFNLRLSKMKQFSGINPLRDNPGEVCIYRSCLHEILITWFIWHFNFKIWKQSGLFQNKIHTSRRMQSTILKTLLLPGYPEALRLLLNQASYCRLDFCHALMSGPCSSPRGMAGCVSSKPCLWHRLFIVCSCITPGFQKCNLIATWTGAHDTYGYTCTCNLSCMFC